jgi:tetratricopeptide (TPR) repeat protein
MALALQPAAFVSAVRPFLQAKDSAGLTTLLRARWSPEQICQLLESPDIDARKVAALCLGLVGGRKCIDRLCPRLSDPDPLVHQMAEHAMWSIWFRLGATPAANADLCRGAQALGRRDFDRAFTHFNAALTADPNFAEAYNQRAIAHYLRDEFAESIDDCRQTIRLMPCHFGALAGMGHCHLHLDQLNLALRSYRRALDVYPHLHDVRQAAAEIECRLATGHPSADATD